MSDTLELAKTLMQRTSITPHDAGCQEIISQYLHRLGFKCENMPFGETRNLWARLGDDGPLFVFAGHTDVVPPGPENEWHSPPFEPCVRDNHLFGRGAQDMKAALAAMMTAVDTFIQDNPDFPGSIAFLITSDEEGDAEDGTRKVIEVLQKRNEKINYCLVGEASSDRQLGDRIRIGRRGSLHGKVTIQGKQGHIANPQFAINPIHIALPALLDLTRTEWDKASVDFPATTFQISNIHAGTGVSNMIPDEMDITFNLRFSPATTVEEIQRKTHEIFDKYSIPFNLEWKIGGKPFYSKPGKLTEVCKQIIRQRLNLDTRTSTGGGTSDGRFIAATGAEIVELGFCNDTAHQINECIPCDDLETLKSLYRDILHNIFMQ